MAGLHYYVQYLIMAVASCSKMTYFRINCPLLL